MRAVPGQLVLGPELPGIGTDRADPRPCQYRMIDVDGSVDDGHHDLRRAAASILAQLTKAPDQAQVAVRVHDRPAGRDI